MSKEYIDRVLKFVDYAYRLKEIKRKGWIERNVSNPESVADHSFLTTLLSMLIADIKGLNVERSMRIAILHDLCEAIIGDRTPSDRLRIGLENSEREEDEAMEKILSNLPQDLSKMYLDIWRDYKDGCSEEAKLVKRLDALERALQAINYTSQGRSCKSLEEFWRELIQHEEDEFLSELLIRYLKLKTSKV